MRMLALDTFAGVEEPGVRKGRGCSSYFPLRVFPWRILSLDAPANDIDIVDHEIKKDRTARRI